ncbi:SPX domain-domain-containing protein [Lobosporangium transversale]|uniref:SPX domain-domain-containing protein n=1 Tax=Lobosporangium transversale TaxID=64571 RepID=A0A1Y2GWT8_9FUNG|nr:SPX domain-domain-containing protein [Lobosporangium transversale]ORZ21817.1 SPX domain-domain-containing protein [Lobosporangium transversale]|eukprot:XP_021883068.1 SPX domain-domain-containing protein [Lobosporangium transversale]
MKFAKYLQNEAVPEWRKAYINYKQGKKYLKAIERTLDQIEADAQAEAEVEETGTYAAENNRIPSHMLQINDLERKVLASDQLSLPLQYDPSPPLSSLPLLPPESFPTGLPNTGASTPILSGKHGRTRNYSAIVISPPPTKPTFSLSEGTGFSQDSIDTDNRSRPIEPTMLNDSSQMEVPSSGQNLRRLIKSASSGSRFSHAALSRGSRFFKSISRRFTIISPHLDIPLRTRAIQIDDGDIHNVLEQLLPEERAFFQFLDSQLEIVNNFYREKELEAVAKLKVIKQQLYVANEWQRRYDDKMVPVIINTT